MINEAEEISLEV